MTETTSIKQILVPVRFDEESERLVAYAGSLARALGVELLLLYNTGTPELTFTQQSRFIQALRTLAEHQLAKQQKYEASLKGFECVVRPGTLQQSIKSVVQDYSVDLVLMNAVPVSEQTTSEGDHAATLMTILDIPVMVVPVGKSYKKLKHLVFVTDFTDREPNVLQRIHRFAKQAGARLTLVQVYTMADKPQLSAMNNAMREVEALLSSKKVNVRLLEEEDMLEGISDFAEQEGADMLLMATQDNYLMQRLFSNAYVKTMAYHTQIPLLTYRQHKRKPCSGCCANCKSKLNQLPLNQQPQLVNIVGGEAQ
ncbi:universal stress protein [Pontibacter anaerobius]|uniref:Universal stress protein n=1 Tax=Pontibacter anaerobius TaxID=2993940 RepID=A0ABT3RD18_9BACT|nr:universal stress protein [Pontibacter anaerobius]MCX2739344.1 universal stress protein [Pontibacter anaerobius]